MMEHPFNKGYTLIELLMSLSVIFIIMGLMLPSVFGVNKQAVRTQCANNLRQVSQVLNAWAMSHDYFPENYEQLVKEGYVNSLIVFKCPYTNSTDDYEFLIKGRAVDSVTAGEAIVRCRHCNMSVFMDTHVEEY
jgi:prepilin-type N-terminal cleavage/methylation domain-containing protein